MLSVDIERFWADDELAHKDNCFSKEAPQVALGIRMSDECVFAELGEPGNPWGTLEREKRIAFNKRYNDLAEQIVGIRLLNEKIPLPEECFPAFKEIGEVFGGQYVDNGNSIWLKAAAPLLRNWKKCWTGWTVWTSRALSCRQTGNRKRTDFGMITARNPGSGMISEGL